MEESPQSLGKEELDKVQKILETETLSSYLLIKLRHNWESVLADLGLQPEMIRELKKEVQDWKSRTTVQDVVILAVKDWATKKRKEATLEQLISIFSSNNLQALSALIFVTPDLILAVFPSLQPQPVPMRTNILKILNYDEWEMIFNQIERPQDKLQFIRADPSLANWFEARTMDHLFASVLPIFMNWVEESTDKVPQSVGKELKQSILSSRLVSRRSCAAADAYLDSYWEKKSESPSFFYVGPETKDAFKTIEEIRQFLQEMGNHPENRAPLLTRTTCIPFKTPAVVPPPAVEEEDKLRMNFFKKTGRFLHELFLGFLGIKADGIAGAFLSLQAVLGTTTNLKTFGLVLSPAPGEEVWNPAGRGLIEGEILPFPDLPSLTSLQIDGMNVFGDDTDWIMNHFRSYFPQLKKLRVDNVRLWNDEYDEREDLFPNLESLTFMSVFDNDDEYALETLQFLYAPKLKLFTLNLNYVISQRKLRAIKRVGVQILNERFPNGAPWEFESEEDADDYVRHELKFSSGAEN